MSLLKIAPIGRLLGGFFNDAQGEHEPRKLNQTPPRRPDPWLVKKGNAELDKKETAKLDRTLGSEEEKAFHAWMGALPDAPAGATHYSPVNDLFYRRDGGVWLVWQCHAWGLSAFGRDPQPIYFQELAE